MLLVTSEYFERLLEDTKKFARLLKHKRQKSKNPSHDSCDAWFTLRQVQYPTLRRAQKHRQPVVMTLVAERSLRTETGFRTQKEEQ
jgi:hypothetical protein